MVMKISMLHKYKVIFIEYETFRKSRTMYGHKQTVFQWANPGNQITSVEVKTVESNMIN